MVCYNSSVIAILSYPDLVLCRCYSNFEIFKIKNTLSDYSPVLLLCRCYAVIEILRYDLHCYTVRCYRDIEIYHKLF